MNTPTLFGFDPSDPTESAPMGPDPSASHPSAIDPPAHPPPPKSDAAPTGIGAGVNGSANAPESTTPATPTPRRRVRVRATSREAYRSVLPTAGTLAAKILAAHQARGLDGLTDDEGEAELELKPQTYTPRRGELVRAGLLVSSGRKRSTASGRMAVVWVTPAHAPTPRLTSGNNGGNNGDAAPQSCQMEYVKAEGSSSEKGDRAC